MSIQRKLENNQNRCVNSKDQKSQSSNNYLLPVDIINHREVKTAHKLSQNVSTSIVNT